MIFAKWVSTKDKTITGYNEYHTEVGIRNTLVAKEGDIIEVHARTEINSIYYYVCKGVINPSYFWATHTDLKFCESMNTVQEVRIVS
jgi:hypothetical protein